jgi:hypothetical protein
LRRKIRWRNASSRLFGSPEYALDNNIERLSEDHHRRAKEKKKKSFGFASVEPRNKYFDFFFDTNCNEKNLIEVLKQKIFNQFHGKLMELHLDYE